MNTPDNTSSIIKFDKSSSELSSFLLSWIGTLTYYTNIKNYLETHYRSPYTLHSAHINAIEHIESIRKELSIIAQASRRLHEKEKLLKGLLEPIESIYKIHQGVTDTSTIETIYQQIDSELESTFLNITKSTYDQIDSNVEDISKYLISKLYLSFAKDVESKVLSSNSNNMISLFEFSKSLESNNNNNNETLIPNELCLGIYNDYLLNIEFPLPALVASIYMEARFIQGKALNELHIFGEANNTNESSIIQFWKYSKGPYKLWVCSICGKILAYLVLTNKYSDEVTKVLSRIKSNSR